ncbi:putative cytoplasmic protein [Salmonella enterica subsp. enterica serovar Typhi]|nr:putative cytoplasmic protein [Salmonella enterica subsp. enterica serovar Typhi]
MEFYENRPRQPFIGYVQLRRALKRWWLRKRACQALRRMSDEQLKDIGLERKDVE